MIPNLTKSLFAIFASSGEGAVDKDDLVSKLFPTNPWDVVIQISAFVILLLIVFFIAYKPVRKLLQQRSEYVEGQITSAEEANKVAQATASKKEETIEEGKKEAARIVKEAKEEASKEATRIIAEAKDEATKRRIRADEESEEAKEASLQEVKENIVDVALAASSKVLEREVSKEDNERLISDFVDSVYRGEEE